jgi:hypothetical protein
MIVLMQRVLVRSQLLSLPFPHVSRELNKLSGKFSIQQCSKAVSSDPAAKELTVESVKGTVFRHAPVPYEIYRVIASSRFPEKIYRHLIADHVLPAAVFR